MANIFNNPGQTQDDSSGWVIGLIAIVILALLAIFFLPRLVTTQPATTNVIVPADNTNPPANVYNTTINASSTTNNSTTTP